MLLFLSSRKFVFSKSLRGGGSYFEGIWGHSLIITKLTWGIFSLNLLFFGVRVLELKVLSAVTDRDDKRDRETISCQIVNTGFSHLDWFLGMSSWADNNTTNWGTKYCKNVVILTFT